jgi:hypothetical protein
MSTHIADFETLRIESHAPKGFSVRHGSIPCSALEGRPATYGSLQSRQTHRDGDVAIGQPAVSLAQRLVYIPHNS